MTAAVTVARTHAQDAETAVAVLAGIAASKSVAVL